MRSTKCIQKVLALSLMFLCTWSCISISWAAEAVTPPIKVAILPFTMHAPNDLAYLQDGIRDMLASRLAWQGKIQVLDRAVVNQAFQGAKADISLSDAQRIGRTLKADHVLFGSLTALGQSISIDAKMAPVAAEGSEPIALYAQTKSLDDVIPKINQFAQEISQKVFARPGDQTQAQASSAPSDAEASSTRNPELLVPSSMMQSNDKISYLNPNFVEVTPEGSLNQPGFWRSQTFQGAFVGMDVGDLDGDGRNELVAITTNKLTVFRKEANGLKTIATFDGPKMDRLLWVTVVDVNRDGKGEIYVTDLRKRNLTTTSGGEGVQGNRGYTEELASFALSFANGKLQVLCDRLPYFLNGVEFPKRGKVLIGQEKGQVTEGPFKPEAFEMQLRGDSLVTSVPANLPARCNVFNFVKADINKDHMDETIYLDEFNHLVIVNATGDQLWKSDKLFAATTNFFEGKVSDRRYNDIDVYSIPSSILITDLNKDGIPEIVAARSTDTLGKLMPNASRFFEKAEIVSLAWDQLGPVENWKTREIAGMVTSVRLADLNNDGKFQLVVSMVMAKDFMKLWESKSTIFSYELNVSPQKAAPGVK